MNNFLTKNNVTDDWTRAKIWTGYTENKIEHVWEIPCMEGEVVVLLGRGDPVW